MYKYIYQEQWTINDAILPCNFSQNRLRVGPVPPFARLVDEENNTPISHGQEEIFHTNATGEENPLEDRNVRKEAILKISQRALNSKEKE